MSAKRFVAHNLFNAMEAIGEKAVALNRSYAADPALRKRVYDVARFGNAAIGAARGALKGHRPGAYEDLTPEELKKRKTRDRGLGALAGALRGYSDGHILGGGEQIVGGFGGKIGVSPRLMMGVSPSHTRDFLHTVLPAIAAEAIDRRRKDDRYTTELGRAMRFDRIKRLGTFVNRDSDELKQYDPQSQDAAIRAYRPKSKHDVETLRHMPAYTRPLDDKTLRRAKRQKTWDSVSSGLELLSKVLISPRLGSTSALATAIDARRDQQLGGLKHVENAARKDLERALSTLGEVAGHTKATEHAWPRPKAGKPLTVRAFHVGSILHAGEKLIPRGDLNFIGNILDDVTDDPDSADKLNAAIDMAAAILEQHVREAKDPAQAEKAQKLVERLMGEYMSKQASLVGRRNAQKLRGLIESYLRQQPAQG